MPQGTLYGGMPWWPWDIQVNLTTVNVKRGTGKCSQLRSV